MEKRRARGLCFRPVAPAGHRHHGLQQHRALMLAAAAQDENVDIADGQVRPGLMTRPLATSVVPSAGAIRFILNSTVSTDASAGISEKAA